MPSLFDQALEQRTHVFLTQIAGTNERQSLTPPCPPELDLALCVNGECYPKYVVLLSMSFRRPACLNCERTTSKGPRPLKVVNKIADILKTADGKNSKKKEILCL